MSHKDIIETIYLLREIAKETNPENPLFDKLKKLIAKYIDML